MPRPTAPHTPSLRTVGERLRYARERAGYDGNSLNRLARYRVPGESEEKTIPPGTVSRLEADKFRVPNLWMLKGLAEVLGVRLVWLILGELPMELRGSGERPSVAPSPMLKTNLQRTVEALNVRSRWSAYTVAVAERMPTDYVPDRWREVLDSIEAAIAPVMRAQEGKLASGRFSRATRLAPPTPHTARKKGRDPDPET